MEYSDAALARLNVSSAAHELAEMAGDVVVPRESTIRDVQELLEATMHLIDQAQEIQRLTVIYARERAVSWADIGDALCVTRQSAQERHGKALTEWRDTLYDPDRHRDLGPAATPDETTARLDIADSLPPLDTVTSINDLLKRTQWLHKRVSRGEPISVAAQAAYDQRKAVVVPAGE